MYVDSFDGKGGDLGEEDAAESVGDRGIDVYEVEFGEEGGVAVEFDTKCLGISVRYILVREEGRGAVRF